MMYYWIITLTRPGYKFTFVENVHYNEYYKLRCARMYITGQEVESPTNGPPCPWRLIHARLHNMPPICDDAIKPFLTSFESLKPGTTVSILGACGA